MSLADRIAALDAQTRKGIAQVKEKIAAVTDALHALDAEVTALREAAADTAAAEERLGELAQAIQELDDIVPDQPVEEPVPV